MSEYQSQSSDSVSERTSSETKSSERSSTEEAIENDLGHGDASLKKIQSFADKSNRSLSLDQLQLKADHYVANHSNKIIDLQTIANKNGNNQLNIVQRNEIWETPKDEDEGESAFNLHEFFDLFFDGDIDASILSDDKEPVQEITEDEVPVDLSFLDDIDEENQNEQVGDEQSLDREDEVIFDSLEEVLESLVADGIEQPLLNDSTDPLVDPTNEGTNVQNIDEETVEKKNKQDYNVEGVYQDMVANGAEQPNLPTVINQTDQLINGGVNSDSLNIAAGSRDQTEFNQFFDVRGETPQSGEQESMAPEGIDSASLGIASAIVSGGMAARNFYQSQNTENTSVQKSYYKEKGKDNLKDIAMQAGYVFIPQVAATIAAARSLNDTKDAVKHVLKLKKAKKDMEAAFEKNPNPELLDEYNKFINLADWLINKKERRVIKRGIDTTAASATAAASFGEVSGVSAGVAVFSGGSVAGWRTVRGVWKKFVRPGKRKTMARNLIEMYKNTNKEDAKKIMEVFGISEDQISDPEVGLSIVMEAFKS